MLAERDWGYLIGNHTWDHPPAAVVTSCSPSNGGVHNFSAPWYGSAAGTLGAGVTAVGLAAAQATGGYWILKSDGGVSNYHAPWDGSLTGQLPPGQTVTGIGGE